MTPSTLEKQVKTIVCSLHNPQCRLGGIPLQAWFSMKEISICEMFYFDVTYQSQLKV